MGNGNLVIVEKIMIQLPKANKTGSQNDKNNERFIIIWLESINCFIMLLQ